MLLLLGLYCKGPGLSPLTCDFLPSLGHHLPVPLSLLASVSSDGALLVGQPGQACSSSFSQLVSQQALLV